MIPNDIFQRFSNFAKTPEYLEGLFVEVSGMAVDILLLTILVPTIFWLAQLRGKIQAQRIASFLSLQFLRACTTLLLRTGGIHNLNEALDYELENGRMSELFSHSIYGNTENLLQLLQSRMASGSHILGHRSLEIAAIRELREETESLVRQCEQYTVQFSSLRLHNYSERCFITGVALFGLRDYLQHMMPLAGSHRPVDSFRTLSTGLATVIDDWFSKERIKVDKSLRRRDLGIVTKLVLLVPYSLIHRYLVGPIATRVGIFYRHPGKLEIVRVILENSYERFGSEEVFKTHNLSGKQLRAILSQSCATDEAIDFLLAIRPCFPEEQWDSVLTSAIFEELYRVKPNPMTANAYIADTMRIYESVALKKDKEILRRIMLWTRSYESMYGSH